MQLSTISIKMKNTYHSDVIMDTIHYYKINPLMNSKTEIKEAVMTIYLSNTRSISRAFSLPNNCSAPPDIAPDKPALCPNCNKIKIIIISASMTNKACTAVATFNILTKNKQS